MKRFVPVLLIGLLLPLHVISVEKATEGWEALPRRGATSFVLPSPVLKLVSLEFDGVLSDYYALRSLVFWGQILERKQRLQVDEWEWRSLHAEIVAAVDLDPYARGPYIFAQGVLVWEAEMYDEVNRLLVKGEIYRKRDWLLPFYRGFNYFYFLNNNALASRALMEAARRPGAGPLLASLATRLATQGQQTENAILFLTRMLEVEEDVQVRSEYKLRLEALKHILVLEHAVEEYRSRFGVWPFSLSRLVDERILDEIPADPYGGMFYIDLQGNIQATSRLRRPN